MDSHLWNKRGVEPSYSSDSGNAEESTGYRERSKGEKKSAPGVQPDKDTDNGEELLQMVVETTEVLQQEYLQKQELAATTLEKSLAALMKEKKVQQGELAKCTAEKKILIDGITNLSTKYDTAFEQQQRLRSRIDVVLAKLHKSQTVLSAAEKQMKQDIVAVRDKLDAFGKGIDEVERKFIYQETQTDDKKPQAQSKNKQNLNQILSMKGQLMRIRQSLENEGTTIFDLLHRVNHLKEHHQNE